MDVFSPDVVTLVDARQRGVYVLRAAGIGTQKPFSPRESKPGKEVTEMKLVIEIVEDSRVLVHHPGT
ncbi:hypothetical protein [Streptomyces sp. CBMA152]|uniref:hypothetical protein n=1 Tax=Streptomyces sp. CBMA152 TaxID=1896312 RepID=UPI001660325A|nr:hypothetical protein [Streptomyces sp. CBMA152]